VSLPIWLPINAIWFLLAGLAGLLGHYISKRGRGEIAVSLFEYLFIETPGLTLAIVLSLIAADFAAVAFAGLEDAKITVAVASGFTAGWTLDSGISQRRCDHEHDS